MMDNSAVGFFDSGVGGLSVYSRFRALLPNENTCYLGDLKNMPYGSKTPGELVGFARKILDYYKKLGVKAVVIACNTSSAIAYDKIKNDYDFKIYPIIQSVAKAISACGYKRVGVFATPATVGSGAYKREIVKYSNHVEVLEQACPNWTCIVESGNIETEGSVTDVKSHLDEMMKFKPEKIILGCTHYPYLIPVLSRFAPENLFIDPALIFVNYIKSDMSACGLLNTSNQKGYEKFYVTAKPDEFKSNAKRFCELKELPSLIEL